ncbi:MAG: hypothetical protein M1832_006261 [Thelocarpon impressellum]|nr:MAG: hypothetical protein M1832_006261 [Thelocarpon impressellum]
MAASVAYKHYLRALNHWPKDLLRPEVSFTDALRRRADARFLQKTQDSPSTAPAAVSTTKKRSEEAELAQVNVLYSFLEDRYSKKYAVSESFVRPASNPNHYSDLLAELDAAPKRSWLETRLNKWKGFLRFS